MEVWKDIEGYEGYYQVSNLGRVKSLERVVQGGRWGFQKEKSILMGQSTDSYGYKVVGLRKLTRRHFKVHRLVAIAFIENKDSKDQVNHKNGIKSDNRVENLEWVTAKENNIHAVKIGLKKGVKGEKNHYSKLKFQEVEEIRMLIKKGYSYSRIASIYNVSSTCIYSIDIGKSWNH
jgi:tRNA U55 pseudouridine synthase TruB